MKGSSKKVASVTAVAQIGDVRLFGASAKRRVRHASEIGDDAVLTVGHGARVRQAPKEGGTFVIVAGVEAKVSSEGDAKAPPFIHIKVSYEVSYRLPDGFSATREELEDFAKVNAVFNVWPYCREFIQSTSASMGLPPIVLPLFRVPQSGQSRRVEKSAEAVASLSTSDS